MKGEARAPPIISKAVIKYLGVMINAKLSFRERHTEFQGTPRLGRSKGSQCPMALVKMLPNIGQPKHSRRLLLFHSALRVTCLAGGVCKLPAVEQMNVVDQLMTLTVCRALRTSLDEAILVMSGMIPADILGKEINMLYHARHMEGHTERTNAKRSESNDIS